MFLLVVFDLLQDDVLVDRADVLVETRAEVHQVELVQRAVIGLFDAVEITQQ